MDIGARAVSRMPSTLSSKDLADIGNFRGAGEHQRQALQQRRRPREGFARRRAGRKPALGREPCSPITPTIGRFHVGDTSIAGLSLPSWSHVSIDGSRPIPAARAGAGRLNRRSLASLLRSPGKVQHELAAFHLHRHSAKSTSALPRRQDIGNPHARRPARARGQACAWWPVRAGRGGSSSSLKPAWRKYTVSARYARGG